MKIEQDVPDLFHPVVLTLESKQEVETLKQSIDARLEVIDGNAEFATEYDWLATIGDFLENVS